MGAARLPSAHTLCLPLARARARRYVRRRTQERFREALPQDGGALQQAWQQAQQEMELVKRQSTVYSLYARKQRSVLVSCAAAAAPPGPGQPA